MRFVGEAAGEAGAGEAVTVAGVTTVRESECIFRYARRSGQGDGLASIAGRFAAELFENGWIGAGDFPIIQPLWQNQKRGMIFLPR